MSKAKRSPPNLDEMPEGFDEMLRAAFPNDPPRPKRKKVAGTKRTQRNA